MTLKELSQILGLSPTTVSRALNGYPEVRVETRRRVEAAARLHNYTPNTRAKRLAMGRAMTIGHVLPMSKEHEMVNPIFSDFIAGAGERYRQSGYGLLLTVVRDEDEAATYQELARSMDVDGVVVHGPKVNDPRIAMLKELGLPFVVHGRSSDTAADYSWVDVNNRSAFRRGTEFLLDLGHTRIGLINGLAEMDFVMRREAGFRQAMAARGAEVDPTLMTNGEMTEPYGYRAAREMLSRSDPPTALILSSIIPAIGARRALEDLSLTPGRDVSLLVHDDDLSYFRNYGDVPLYTATRSSVREAGEMSADLLLERIAEPDSPTRSVLLEADLVVGQSTARVRE